MINGDRPHKDYFHAKAQRRSAKAQRRGQILLAALRLPLRSCVKMSVCSHALRVRVHLVSTGPCFESVALLDVSRHSFADRIVNVSFSVRQCLTGELREHLDDCLSMRFGHAEDQLRLARQLRCQVACRVWLHRNIERAQDLSCFRRERCPTRADTPALMHVPPPSRASIGIPSRFRPRRWPLPPPSVSDKYCRYRQTETAELASSS